MKFDSCGTPLLNDALFVAEQEAGVMNSASRKMKTDKRMFLGMTAESLPRIWLLKESNSSEDDNLIEMVS